MELAELLTKKPMFCADLRDRVQEFFADGQHEEAFRAWYKEKYGKEYEPKRTLETSHWLRGSVPCE